MSVVCGRAPLYDNDDNDDYDDYDDDDDYENEDDGNVARNAAGDHDKYDSCTRQVGQGTSAKSILNFDWLVGFYPNAKEKFQARSDWLPLLLSLRLPSPYPAGSYLYPSVSL
ncbi:hypothetical protein HZH66_002935 [Vespula vulgaris]|uniref:Uncharacterized protein n=1 Tax=Vespula vulgaris TaxID=7454 RepID=A0A834KKN6_VESVU|nr:hypothetical protein HZH66_002935 [Vespula vulgaris]